MAAETSANAWAVTLNRIEHMWIPSIRTAVFLVKWRTRRRNTRSIISDSIYQLCRAVWA